MSLMNSSFSSFESYSRNASGERTLLHEIQELLPQSYLIFLLADLRWMSGTGRIATKYETLALDSDACSRTKATQLAGLELDGVGDQSHPEIGEGLSPAQIMAIVLLEIKNTSEQVGQEKNWREDGAREEDIMGYRKDKKKKRSVEDSMESLMRAYSRMIANDLCAKVPSVQRRQLMVGDVPRAPDFAQAHGRLSSIVENDSEDEDHKWPTSSNEDSAEANGRMKRISSGNFLNSPKPVEIRVGPDVPQPSPLKQPDISDVTVNLDDFQNSTGSKGKPTKNPAHDQPFFGDSDSSSLVIPKLSSSQTDEKEQSTSDYNLDSRGDRRSASKSRSPRTKQKSYDSIKHQNSNESDGGTRRSWTRKKTNEGSSSDRVSSVPEGKSRRGSNETTKPSAKKKSPRFRRRNTEPHSIKKALSRDSGSDRSLDMQDLSRDGDSIDEGDSSVGFAQIRKERLRQMATQIRQRRDHFAAEMRNRRVDLRDEVSKLRQQSNQDALTHVEFKELTEILFDMGQSSVDVKQSIGTSKSPKELTMLMKKAVEARSFGKLRFLSKLFKEGSVSKLMAESSSRIVWMNDWYPLTDLTYAIAVDQELKRVLVVFRGAITKTDWNAVTSFSLTRVPNPVQEDFPGKSEKIRLYKGFYKYLFRKRKDTGSTKYDEIVNLAHRYGMEKIGPDYNLVLTGHSLGAALAVFVAFYASCDERFIQNGPVKVITFSGPYCGGHTFADTFRHQERCGKIQLVRVHNDNDPVPHLPFNFKVDGRGCYWRHVGIGVKLPPVPSGLCLKYICFWNRWWRPRVFYIGKEKSWMRSTCRGVRNNLIFNFPWRQPWGFAKMHTVFELQDRLMYGIKIEKLGGEFDLLMKPIDELYDILQRSNFDSLESNKSSNWQEQS